MAANLENPVASDITITLVHAVFAFKAAKFLGFAGTVVAFQHAFRGKESYREVTSDQCTAFRGLLCARLRPVGVSSPAGHNL